MYRFVFILRALHWGKLFENNIVLIYHEEYVLTILDDSARDMMGGKKSKETNISKKIMYEIRQPFAYLR